MTLFPTYSVTEDAKSHPQHIASIKYFKFEL